MSKKLLWAGVTGAVIAALCRFTPVLANLLGAIGLSAWLGWADYVTIPALVFCVLLTAYALYRNRQPNAVCKPNDALHPNKAVRT